MDDAESGLVGDLVADSRGALGTCSGGNSEISSTHVIRQVSAFSVCWGAIYKVFLRCVLRRCPQNLSSLYPSPFATWTGQEINKAHKHNKRGSGTLPRPLPPAFYFRPTRTPRSPVATPSRYSFATGCSMSSSCFVLVSPCSNSARSLAMFGTK